MGTMLGLSLPAVVCGKAHVLFVMVCVWQCPTHVVFVLFFLRLVFLMLQVSLDCHLFNQLNYLGTVNFKNISVPKH